MVKERLKDIEIKITELASYLGISRPTMYKFIDAYDEGKKEIVSKPVLRLFEYIESDNLIGKNNVIAFILNNLTDIKETDIDEANKIVNLVRQYVSSNLNSEKTQFISKSVASSEFDIMIHYMMEVQQLLKQETLDEDGQKKVNLFNEIIKIYLGSNKEEK